VLKDEAEVAVKHGITLTICDNRLLKHVTAIAKKTKTRPKVHIKVDTGMGRIGVWYEDALEFIRKVSRNESMELEGVYTHFSSAGRDKTFTRSQIKNFEKILKELEKENITVKYRHAANSIAVVDWKKSHLNLVRPGILIYGIYPKESFRRKFKLRPAMNLKTRIVYLKDAPRGRSISYGRTYVTKKPTKIATIPIGYADGYGRILSNKAKALVRGKYAKIAGIVTMDQVLLDVGHIKDVRVGDEVVLIGKQGQANVPVEKVARLAGTIPYEIVSGITDRVPRIYT
jgi:alanine racemase